MCQAFEDEVEAKKHVPLTYLFLFICCDWVANFFLMIQGGRFLTMEQKGNILPCLKYPSSFVCVCV